MFPLVQQHAFRLTGGISVRQFRSRGYPPPGEAFQNSGRPDDRKSGEVAPAQDFALEPGERNKTAFHGKVTAGDQDGCRSVTERGQEDLIQ